MHDHREPDVADALRHAFADADPLVGRTVEPEYAAVVLLV